MKTVLITGGSRGIGAATVKLFAHNGYTVILNYNRSEDKAKQLQQLLLSQGCDVHLYKADVSMPSAVQDMAQYIGRYFKKLNVLINNAGVSLKATLSDTSVRQYSRVMNVNCKGTFLTCKYMLPLLQKAEDACVINMSSIWGVEGASCESVYAMSKHAVKGLSLSLAKEWQYMGIRVNCVCPPIVLTDMAQELSKDDKDEFCNTYNTQVLTAEQVAKVVFDTVQSNQSGVVISAQQCAILGKGE